MDDRQAELYRRIDEFPLEEPQAALTFSARLARENGWSQVFARRVIDEYRRFAFLAVAAGHPVAPSDEVDQAWHLHLTSTRAYWHGFCAELGRPLHHQPTRGGPDELAKHSDWYAQTLASYSRLFGREPPGDIWPPAELRFHSVAAHRRVDLGRCWVIPKPGWRQLQAATLMAGGLLPVALLASPFDFDGPHFLTLYALMFAIALTMACGLRFALRGGDLSEDAHKLDVYAAGCLAGGKQQAIRAATAALVQQDVLEVRREETKLLGFLPGANEYSFVACQAPRRDSPPLERAICDAAKCGQTMKQLYRSAGDEAAKLAARLEDAGLILSADQAAKVRWLPALIMAALAGFGAIKIAVGISRGRPVIFLALGVVATLIVAAMFLNQSLRSRAGDRLLKRLKERHASLQRSDYTGVSAEHLALAIGLFGPAILAGGPLDDLRYALGAQPPQKGGDGGCGSGCRGGGCGGGCGGCGGCS